MINRIQVVNSCMVNIMIFQSYKKSGKPLVIYSMTVQRLADKLLESCNPVPKRLLPLC